MTSRQPTGSRTPVGRVPELDALRFVAAAAVMVYHLTYRPRIHGEIRADAFGPLADASRFGYLGVTLFFMISGFVILWSSQARSAGQFLASRVARLFPSFWACIAITSVVVNFMKATGEISWHTIALNATMVPGALGVPYVDGVYWTLFVELKFYFLIFVVLATGTMARAEAWLALWLAASVVCATGIAPGWLDSLALYPYGPYFIAGCLFYLLRARGPSAFRFGGLVVTCVLGAMYAVAQQPDFMNETSRASSIVVAGTVVALHGVFAVVALRPSILPPSRWWYWLGSLTYPLYLLHSRISKEIAASPRTPEGAWTLACIQLVVVIGLAAVLAALIERRACSRLQRMLIGWVDRGRAVFARSTPEGAANQTSGS